MIKNLSVSSRLNVKLPIKLKDKSLHHQPLNKESMHHKKINRLVSKVGKTTLAISTVFQAIKK